jgi:hypothetical protein
MRIAIHQPNFLPWLGFYYKASQCDLFVLLDDVQFIRRGFTQRNYVKGPHGEQLLGVPLITKGRYYQTIAEVEINNETRWQAKMAQTLRLLYSKAPAAGARLDVLTAIIQQPHPHLVDLNIALLEATFEMLGITTPVVRSSKLPNISGASTERLISICKSLSATEYLSGAGGKKYQSEEAFEQSGIKLIYSDFDHPIYPQLYGDFVPQLSVVDYLMNVEAAGMPRHSAVAA